MEYLTPSKTNPIYSIAVIANSTKKRYAIQSINYPESKFVTSLKLTENDGQMAQLVKIELMNAKTDDGYFSGIFDVMDRVFVYANDGERSREVFRGFIWERPYSSAIEKTLTLTCYDNLIYLMKSQVSEYFAAGKDTKTIMNTLCNSWGIKLSYDYKSITHPKLPLSGYLADVMIDDVLNEVKKQTGTKYVIRSVQDVMHVKTVGTNEEIFKIQRTGGGAISTRSDRTMEEVVTKIIITGSSDDNGKTPVEAVVTGNTSKYGTLQRTQSKDKDTSLADAKKEANTTLKEKGQPKKTFELQAIDIPWVRKGDKVKVTAGDMNQHYIVLSVTHDASTKKMDLEVELPS